MLCLDEGTPVVMALCLVGSVLFIVGGSFWGSGDYSNDSQRTIAGIVMLSISLLLLGLSGLGCWCNRFFCTPDRKSSIALRLYGSRPPLPPADDLPDDAEASTSNRGEGGSELADPVAADRVKDPDWEEYAGSRSYRSFRSGRNSTRGKSRRASLRRDKVIPANPEAGQWSSSSRTQRQKLPTPPDMAPPPLPPHPATDYDSSSVGNPSMVPIEFASPSQQRYSGDNRGVELMPRSHREIGNVQLMNQTQTAKQQMAYSQQQQQQQQQHDHNTRTNLPSVNGYHQRSYGSPQHPPVEQTNWHHQQNLQHSEQPLTVKPYVSIGPAGSYSNQQDSHRDSGGPANPGVNGGQVHVSHGGHMGFNRSPAPAETEESARVSQTVII